MITTNSSDNDVECAVLSLMSKDGVTITVLQVGMSSIATIACRMAKVANSKPRPNTKDLNNILIELAYLAFLVPDDKVKIIKCVNNWFENFDFNVAFALFTPAEDSIPKSIPFAPQIVVSPD